MPLAISGSGPLTEQAREALGRDLAAEVAGDVDFGTGARAMFGADASNYRRIPVGVVYPRSAEDVAVTLRYARDAGIPMTMRGGGTSIAGNSIGTGIVVDTSRYLNRVLAIDPDKRTARVEPGLVLNTLQRAAAPHGLRFGPDPSTASRCTLGGMIGNNACGSHSIAWGTTAQNVESLDLLRGDGTLMTVGSYSPDEWQDLLTRPGRDGRIYRELQELEGRYREPWRTELSSYSRRVSGYGVDHLLPERGRSLAKALVGSEGTCAVVVGATVRLVAPPPARVLVVLGYTDDIAAADTVPALLELGPLTVEGLDSELVAVVGSAPALPAGSAWLFVELGGDDAADALARAHATVAAVGSAAVDARIVTDPADAARLWRIRADGAGLATRDASGGEAWPGWEDSAVPPERLGSYLREFRALLRRHGLRGLSYGHFGEGCIHVRINFDMLSDHGVGVFRSFLEEAADIVVAHGGSLSGEHGDGFARSELLSRMYSAPVLDSFAAFKRVWDPDGVLNPGVVVDPVPLDEGLRHRRSARAVDLPTPALHFPEDNGDLATALRRCVGVGKCRSDVGAVMCPSWLVTGEEKHSTRGRARILQEIVNGEFVEDGFRSKDALEALDLCLSCKGCSSDCPTGVDMATYKAEFLHQHYKGRVRPMAHLSMGWLPLTARIATRLAPVVNAVTRSRLSGLIKRLGGIDPQRQIPEFAPRSFVSQHRRGFGRQTGRPVVLWPDTFNNHLSPSVLSSAVRVLEAAGLAPTLPDGGVCCGLTWFSTGQLTTARKVLERTARILAPAMEAGLPIVVLEPSCATMLRSESRAVLGETPFTTYLVENVVTLAEALERYAPDWQPPAIDRPAVGQVHCHQSSVLGYDADRRLMARAGIDTAEMQQSCCGLAGNFGFEKGHFDVSRAAGERLLLPAIEGAPDDAVLLADGYSCRTQVQQLAGQRPQHLVEALAAALDANSR
ncbi:MAG: putative FAD-linked oxidoreductase [Mycobacterium sp.]|nr:putative FAD-linked oxidoreductase [Mycobacterium sp.]